MVRFYVYTEAGLRRLPKTALIGSKPRAYPHLAGQRVKALEVANGRVLGMFFEFDANGECLRGDKEAFGLMGIALDADNARVERLRDVPKLEVIRAGQDAPERRRVYDQQHRHTPSETDLAVVLNDINSLIKDVPPIPRLKKEKPLSV